MMKETCPICNKQVAASKPYQPSRLPMRNHYKDCHLDKYDDFVRECIKEDKAKEKRKSEDKKRIAKRESDKKSRVISISSEFAQSIIDEMKSLSGMMEGYYSTSPGVLDDMEEIIKKLENLIEGRPADWTFPPGTMYDTSRGLYYIYEYDNESDSHKIKYLEGV